jgi:hypothetical protein
LSICTSGTCSRPTHLARTGNPDPRQLPGKNAFSSVDPSKTAILRVSAGTRVLWDPNFLTIRKNTFVDI